MHLLTFLFFRTFLHQSAALAPVSPDRHSSLSSASLLFILLPEPPLSHCVTRLQSLMCPDLNGEATNALRLHGALSKWGYAGKGLEGEVEKQDLNGAAVFEKRNSKTPVNFNKNWKRKKFLGLCEKTCLSYRFIFSNVSEVCVPSLVHDIEIQCVENGLHWCVFLGVQWHLVHVCVRMCTGTLNLNISTAN